MRVLWFANAPLPAVQIHRGEAPAGSGQWMTCLLDQLVQVAGVQMEVATAHPGLDDDEFHADGVRYFVFGQPRFESIFEARKRDLDRCVSLVAERKPDVVHIHGSERFFGLMAARKLIDVPALISIQGLVDECLPVFFGALSPAEIWRSQGLVELATRRGHFWRYRDYLKGAKLGREILANAKAFMGRTAWDRAHLSSVNPAAVYYHGDELLRPQFSKGAWNLDKCERHSVIFTNGGSEPRRGLEVLIGAMRIVLREFPDAQLRLAGTLGNRRSYERFVHRRISDAGLDGAVRHLGYLNADRMAEELQRAHVFAMPSFLENSSNSLCEAMQVGMPCVASYTGGIPSLLDEGWSGLMFPPGDSAMLAAAICRIFRSDDLAARLGESARTAASERHSPARVVAQVMNAYHDLVSGLESANFIGVQHGKAIPCAESR